MILAGDIGGTSTRLAYFVEANGVLKTEQQAVYRSRDYASLDEIVDRFVGEHPATVTAAAFGIAGPVRDGRVQTPNLAWVIEASSLARRLDPARISLLNDLEANAWGIGALGPGDFFELNRGAAEAAGNRAVISAGTGLGEAGLFWDGRMHRPFACEGGHADFAPRSAQEIGLLEHLKERYDRVSYERVLSGPGIVHIFDYVTKVERPELPAWFRDALRTDDPAPVISRAALENRIESAVRTLDLFVALYGAEAGNLALKMLATGGVYVGGGIAPRIIDKLKGPAFMEAFTAKGRMRPLLESIPVKVILNDRTALLGAARYALLPGT